MRLASIASGSNGNCIYIGSEQTHILIDAGVSRKKIEEGLHLLDLDLSDINAVFLTHEHSDHVGGLFPLLNKRDIPVYATGGILQGIRKYDKKNTMDERKMTLIHADTPVLCGDLQVDPFAISHDALEPVCYRVTCQGKKVAVATDLGCYDDYLVDRLQGMDALLLEANYDLRMLQAGPYPYYLKQRILSDNGHLSNDASSRLLIRLLHDHLKGVLLGHLSEQNNLPELAYETVRVEIEMSDNAYHAGDFRLGVATRFAPSEILKV